MRIVQLSDHAGDQLRGSRREQRAAQGEADEWDLRHREELARAERARREKPLWRRALRIASAEERDAGQQARIASLQHAEAEQRSRDLHQRVGQQSAGVKGEEAVERQLQARLNDDWVLFRGYHNRKGENDHLLVGPDGVWVIEVKRANARLSVNGERWQFEKTDRYGNVVEVGDATDRRGRPWGRQASEIAAELEAWLAKNEVGVGIRTAVALNHERAAVVSCINPGVDLVTTSVDELLRQTRVLATSLNADDRRKIERLIERDHRHHAQRRSQRRSPQRR